MKMQVSRAKIKVIGFLVFLLVGCRGGDVTPSPPGTAAPSPESAPTSVPATPSEPAPVGVAGSRSIGDPYAPELGNSGYDAQRYTLQLALDPAVENIAGTVSIDAVATIANLAEISLDFVGFDVETVTVATARVDYRREDKKLIVPLPRPLGEGEPFTVTITYQGAPVKEPSPYVGFTEALGLHFVGNESIYVLSEPDGARYWFPNNDHPRDKATFRFEVTVPEGLTAVANGQLLDVQGGATGQTFIWEHNTLMAPYLAIVAVGVYEGIEDHSPDGVPLRHYVFPHLRPGFETAVAVTGEAMDWMSELFGPYPFEVYGYVTADAPGASLETQTMVLLSTNMVSQSTVIHELAHMWFGNWVSLDSWSEMWRNEGFATYVTLMWQHRDDPEELELEIEAIRAAVAENEPQYPLGNPPSRRLFGFQSYFKGALLVHALREEVGDEAFFAGLRTYFQRYGNGTASDAQFQVVMEEAAGKSLEAFFNEWLK